MKLVNNKDKLTSFNYSLRFTDNHKRLYNRIFTIVRTIAVNGIICEIKLLGCPVLENVSKYSKKNSKIILIIKFKKWLTLYKLLTTQYLTKTTIIYS